MEINYGVKYKNVRWKLSETLCIVKNYNLKKTKEYGLKHANSRVISKQVRMLMPLIKRKTVTGQENINNKIYKYVVKVAKHYNKYRRLDMVFIHSIEPKYLKIVKNCFPQVYFDRMVKETKVLDFMRYNKRNPRKLAKCKKERRIAEFMNNEQYSKRSLLFVAEIEKMKSKNGTISRVGGKRPRSEKTMKELVAFVRKNKRMPSARLARNGEESRLANFFGAACGIHGSNPRPELAKPHLELFLKYMKHPSYSKTKFFFRGVLSGDINWERGKEFGIFWRAK